MSDRWTDRLSEYIDEELDAGNRAALEAHLEQCGDCRVTLAELRLVAARASALESRAPETDLWPGIVERIRSGAADVPSSPPVMLPAWRRRISFTIPQLAAAAVVLILMSGAAMWMALQSQNGPAESIEARAPVVGSSTTLVSNGASMYDADIAQLQATLAAARDSLNPATVAILERNLALIDAAILDAREALRRDPGNAYVNRHLNQTLRTKLEMLRRAASVTRVQT
jgi:hypothetical protein